MPSGVNDLSLTLSLSDSGSPIEGLLIDPNGMQLSIAQNADPAGNPQFGLQNSHYNPQPGHWKFELVQNFASSGNQTSLPFTARIGFNSAPISASGLPDSPSTVLSASAGPVAIPVTVTNNGPVEALYFADARLATPAPQALGAYGCSAATTLPGFCAYYILPTEVSEVEFVAQSSSPISMDAFNSAGAGPVAGTGSPDIFARKVSPKVAPAYTVAASLVRPEVPYSYWYVAPALIGPYGSGGAQPAPIATGALVLMQPFDTTVTSTAGDVWQDVTLGTSTFNPLVLGAGQSGTITVTITPDPTQVGATVNGYLYIDTYNPGTYYGDELVRLPYSYTIGN